MTKQRNREEVVNTQLAVLISNLGIAADAETIQVHGRHRPDVLFQMRGLRVIIESKFADTPDAQQIVLNDARKRVRIGLAHIAAAVVYPLPLRSTSTAKILEVLESSQLQFRIIAETHEGEGWVEGNPAALMEALRRAQEALTQDDIVERTAKSLNIQLQGIAQLWLGQRGACDRLSEILGITPPKGETDEKAHARRETAAKVSALVLANAFIFQEQLAAGDGRVTSLSVIEKETDILGATAKHWRWIWENINYVPIFQLGENVLNELPRSPRSILPVKALLAEAKAICSAQAALRHDLMGRIYHWLLHHAKFLGTYYTSVPAATLLVKLAMAAEWNRDFGDPAVISKFTVADLACGTGTLLMATAQAFTDLYIKTRAETGRPLEEKDLSLLHKTLMQNILYGYDVLPSALHLTASTLAMLAPEVAFVRMNLFIMPLGIDHGHARLGSLDFLESRELKTQIALDYTQAETIRTGAGYSSITNAKLPQLDLCVMNPPFVRSVGGNLLFGSLPDERGEMQAELKRMVKKVGANSTAGLGSVFIALADMHLADNGRLAFVVPAAIASGEAWAATRRLIAERYHLEYVIASHDAARPNFSENTALSEILFIARKRKSRNDKAGVTTYINLWHNPRTVHEALDLANQIARTAPTSIDKAGIASIRSLSKKLGDVVTLPAAQSEENWTGALFAQTELLRVCWRLKNGRLAIPGNSKTFAVPLSKLDSLGNLGYDQRDVHDAFEVSYDDWSPYPSFWNHKADQTISIAQTPNSFLVARTEAAKGRRLKNEQDIWKKSGKILLAERLRTNTHRMIAIGFNKPVLGNTWWSFSPQKLTKDREKALLLWLNSSLAILLVYAARVITESAWFKLKKPAWESMPVLDVRALKTKQLKALASAYDKLAQEELAPLAQLHIDPVRRKIDEALTKALDLPDLAPIRELLAREPGLTAQAINPRRKQKEFDLNEEEENQEQPNFLAARKRAKKAQ